MNIRMVGIDHDKASVEYREQFALTKSSSVQAMEKIKEIEGIEGCVIVSTCNRTEIWVSYHDKLSVDLKKYFCELRKLNYSDYESFLTERESLVAVKHLFNLSCGVKSKVFGEDQIITQVKDALALARDNYCTDHVLEVLFRMAITAAKKVKTNVRLSNANHSVVEEAISYLQREGIELKNKVCMVIGNGEMGKLSATTLKNKNADVTVTVRQYKSGVVEIPKGCKRINYGERMDYINNCDIVISATVSPNCTVKYEELKQIKLEKPLLLLDLAVPRDIDPKVKGLPFVTLYDIDDFKVDISDENINEDLKRVGEILHAQIEEFVEWYECKDVIPLVKQIADLAAKDIGNRVWGVSRKLEMEEECRESLEKNIAEASKKVVDKLIFGLRDNINIDTWRECIEGMNKIYTNND
ncbi:glutamyl-tRNA reductase [Candidatus Galacturonibacter soehngenii]|uniref:Glutamyl-tRNA reductase n=1 Tax=Candidatus Galacturonatibacter soehngenii TaxID=2307010 RepID=A0A7V7UD28_9FIRM|nr:glutamyl-tRNA reductase [Candidatus Galacturonibacter soehngenii]KAB1439881.1 glutamyl-tRNA reductase [Candidatus Galacturonibacter soehngenii]